MKTLRLLFAFSIFISLNCTKEPNTSVDAARDITPGVVVSNHFRHDETEHFYKFTLSEVCLINVIVEGSPGKFTLEVLTGQNGSSTVSSSGWIEKGQDASYWVGPMDQGEHIIRLKRSYPDSLYQFKVEYDCTDKTELNNLFDAATPIAPDVPIEGRILGVNDFGIFEDQDIYKFEVVGRPAVVYLEYKAPNVIWPANRRIKVTVFESANQNTELEPLNDVDAGQQGALLLGPLRVGTHYITVNFDGACNCESELPYRLTLNLDYSDIYEPNDFPIDQATNMELDKMYEGMLTYPNSLYEADVDWFTYTPQQSGIYNLQMKALQSNYYTRCEFYDQPPSGNNHAGYISENQGQSKSFNNLMLQAGQKYWFKMQMNSYWQESTGLYAIKLSKQ